MSAKPTAKVFPQFKDDSEVERFVNEADLSEYDFSGFQPLRFELARKTARVNLRMPEDMVAALKALATKRGVPYQRLIREGVERILSDGR